MSVLNFSSYPLWLSTAIFIAAAAAVWWAGSRLARYADAISDMTGLGQALIGLLLLGGITSLPEIAVSVTAGVTGNAGLAVSNLLGGVSLQMVIIVIGDALLRRQAITFQVSRAAVLLQAVFSALLLCIVVAAILVGDVAVIGVGLWSTAILLLGILMLLLTSRYRSSPTWHPDPEPRHEKGEQKGKPETLRRAVLQTSGVGAIILVAGFLLSKTGEAIAGQTGISENFVGATLLAGATSLPEISTVITAVRIKRYMMAFSDIFGTNIFDVMLIFLIDLAYPGPAVINEVDNFAAFGAVLGAVLTLIYVTGMIERRDETLMRLGADSWAAVVVYLSGIGVLFYLS